MKQTIPCLLGAAAFVSALAAPVARAQVTLNLTTTQQTDCTATTDAQGLALVPGTTELQATGVTLSGAGCGGGDSAFATTVTAPAGATVGTPFTVTWNASAAATQCTFGGTSGASGWPVGGSACSGASCAGSHPVLVTLPTAAAYNFTMTCTNSSGYAQGSTTSSGGGGSPPTPANFALNVPAAVTTGTAFQISWTVSGATACTGSASLNGSSTSLSGWTDSTSAASPRSVTATSAGTYTLGLTCSNASGSVSSTTATTTATAPGGGSCGSGRQCTMNICYDPRNTQCVSNVDITQFNNVWGRSSPTGTIVPFPGVPGVIPIFQSVNRAAGSYISLQINVPSTIPSNQLGGLTYGETGAGPKLDASISSTPGDFSPANASCATPFPRGGGQALVFYKLQGVPSNVNYCPLVAGGTYYLNLKIDNPAENSDACTTTTCKIPILDTNSLYTGQ